MKSKNIEVNQVSNIVAKNLLEEIDNGRYKNASRLPAELEIASYMNVSRTAVRDALSILEMEGFVSRKRGLGTIVNRHVLAIKTRVDLEDEFLEVVRGAGYTPKIKEVIVESVYATQEVADKLLIKEGEEVYKITRTILADDNPCIYCHDYFTKKLLKTNDYSEEELKPPIFEFLDKYCGERVNMDLSEVHAIIANKEVADALNVKTGEPVLNLKETGYNFNGLPIIFSDEYYKEGVMTHTILRKNIGL